MKKDSVQKNITVKDDEKYLEGINLVTGDKINYSRPVLTETELNALCVDEKLSKVKKFTRIMTEGDKIQKWSMFENLALYVENKEGAESILNLIEKNYIEYEQFIAIMGEGIWQYLQKCKTHQNLRTNRCFQIIYRLILRTVTSQKFQGSEVLVDWMNALGLLFSVSKLVDKRQEKISELNDYIKGSFSMNTLPQRRKTALEMIDALFESSQEIEVQSHSKILFFNNDLNPSTRLVICSIMDKILRRQSIPQIWKCVLEYYLMDKSLSVKEKALKTLSEIYYQPNTEAIFNDFDQQKIEMLSIIAECLPTLLKTYQEQIKKDPLNQLKLFSLINRMLKKNHQNFMAPVVQCYKQLTYILPETVLVKELELKNFQLESLKVMTELINLWEIANHIEFKQRIKKQILKGIRYHEFYLKMNKAIANKFLDSLELDVEQDIGVYILMLGRQIEASQWKTILVFLDRIKEIRLCHSHLEKIIGHVMKVYVGCPYFMLEDIHRVIFYLLMVDRKGMQIYLKVREKCLGSKNWMLRRNFIKLYTYFKMNASFEVNKLITPLVYKNIVNEKTALIKVQFTRQFIRAYPYLDPTLPQQKLAVKEVITRFSEDRDYELSQLATKALQIIRDVDKDTQNLNKLMIRNKELLNKQIMIDQIIQDQKKHVKTEKIILGKIPQLREKPKKASMMEAKTSTNLHKIQVTKDLVPEHKSSLVRSNSTQNKKQAPKMLHQPAYKKTRFH